MIKYRLICDADHEFEAWFASSASYDAQARARQIACPHCASHEVGKAIMAPAVAARSADPADGPKPPTLRDDEPQILELVREFRRAVVASTEDVGAQFAQEARKIHHGDGEARNIRGTATSEEAEALSDEGIEFVVLPPLPEDAD